jgi:preflagellin peptidase FlaK
VTALVELAGGAASVPDLLRLTAVPVLGWAAYRDVCTRRVPNRTWYPLVGVGVLAFGLDVAAALGEPPFLLRDLFASLLASLGLIVPLAYLLWRIGGFGGADAKALMALALVFPAFPLYLLPGVSLPLVHPRIGVFPLTILTNTVLAGAAYPLALAVRNAAAGRLHPRMFVARPTPAEAIPREHGRLLGEGIRGGLDLDALRMYLRWRGTSLEAIRTLPELHRDPSTIDRTYSPGDGAVAAAPGDAPSDRVGDGASVADADGDAVSTEPDDPWGAARFLASLDGDAYGTTPEELRAGLDRLAGSDEVWITPGLPFLVPTFLGLCTALTFGDLLFALLALVGVA